MHNFDCITKENIKEHNQKWAKIPDHPYIILITRGSGVLDLENQMRNLI